MKVRSIIPRDAGDPADQKRNLKQAQRSLNGIYARIRARINSYIKTLEFGRREATGNAKYRQPTKAEVAERGRWDKYKPVLMVNRYIYELDAQRYLDIEAFIQRIFYEELLGSESGRYQSNFWFNINTTAAYKDATDELINDVQLSGVLAALPDQEAQQLDLLSTDSFMLSPPVQRRLGLIYARTFNLMKNLSEQSKTDLSEVLTRSMLDGEGIPAITRNIKKRIDVSYGRAMRIARTEIMQSYRSATRDESRELNETVFEDSEWEFNLLWFSALASTTRPNHAAKHGGIYTQQQVSDFYSKGAEAVNCLCSQRPILVNKKTGEVIQKNLIKRLKKQKQTWRAGMVREV